jgi:biopolymer transport protein ExbB
MILAFMEFEQKANPQVSELAPGIYKALVTTLQGLVVAIPALTLYAVFRNRVDELVSQASLLAEHVFAGHRRNVAAKQAAKAAASPSAARARPNQTAGDA